MVQPIQKLEASAGSGKTYKLALEYLGRLLQAFAGVGRKGRDPKRQRALLSSVLAITFTVKAAQEMKRRIVEKLKVFALSEKVPLDKDDGEFLAQLAAGTGLSPGKVIELSGDLIELVLSSYDDFNVMTIDSLMSAMVKVIAPDLDLPADYEIAVKAGDELEACARALLADQADRDWPRVERTLAGLSHLSPSVSWKIDETLCRKLIELFHASMRQGLAIGSRAAEVRKGLPDRGAGDLKRTLGKLREMLAESPRDGYKNRFVNGQKVNSSLLDEMDAFLQGRIDLFKLEQLLLRPFFLKDDPRELLKKGAPEPYAGKLSAAYEAMRPCQQALVMDLSRLKASPQREFFPDFTSAWGHGKQTLFVEEFSQTLAGLFDRWAVEAFPYLYMKMSDRFRNFLFDEFQDTSTLQFKALAPLIDEVLSREKDASLFVVGDRKQAIYRWRGGNSELMEEGRLREQVPAINHLSAAGFSSTLERNWRSRREIVEFNNEFWDPEAISLIAAEDDLRQAIRDNFMKSRQEVPGDGKRDGGYVELSLQVEAEADAREASGETEPQQGDNGALSACHLDRIESIIRRLHDEHGHEFSDIAVLVRKNDQVRDVVRRLGRMGIGSISDQSLMLDSNPRVNEIIAFLRFLDYPPDDLNFYSFVGGEIFRAAAESRFAGEAREFSEAAFIPCRGPFYKLFQEKFPGSWKGLIEPFFQAVGFLPPYDLFSDITQMFDVYKNFSGDTPFFMALGDALHRAERHGGSSIAGFLRQWQRMVEDEETPAVAIPENAPGVRVLTMHQSKGLEFAAVIVPLNDRMGRGEDSIRWDDEGMFYVNASYARAHPGLKNKYQRENIRGSIDLLNLLYVAFTRAREALFIPVAVSDGISAPRPADDGLVKKIARASDAVGRHPLLSWFDEGRERFIARGKPEQKARPARPAARPAPIPSKKVLTRSWQSRYLVFKRTDAKERRDRPGAKRGERIHDLLSRLGAVASPGRLDARVRELAAEAGWPAGDIEAVARFLCRDDVFRLLGRGREFHLEKEIVDNAGKTPKFLRLDRLQAGPEEVLVIDFKTGKEKSEEYHAQMRGYLGAVSPLFPGRKCRGFLLYIDREEIEEVSCSS